MTFLRNMRLYWRDSLTAQTASLMLLCLVGAQWASIWAFCDERAAMLRGVATETLARELSLLAAAGPGAHLPPQEGVHVWTSAERPRSLSDAPPQAVASLEPAQRTAFFAAWADEPAGPLDWRSGPAGVSLADAGRRAAVLTLPAPGGGWLNATLAMPRWTDPWAQQSWSALLFTSIALIAAAVGISHRVIRPMRALGRAADNFAGAQPTPVTVGGPGEVGRSIAAFNTMLERISVLVGERTRMLSALGHDLRTPMTRLRLRAHLIAEDDLRAPVLRDLDEIEDLTERALELARGGGAEPMRRADLRAFLTTLADDLQDADLSVALGTMADVSAPVQRGSLRRAVTNLVENANRYADGAHLALEADADRLRIIVSDDGPGIPEERLSDVVEPFLRLEKSRARRTGGSGLGLALANATAEAHGGALLLRNRPKGGLAAILELPSGSSR
ncbi:ATP-binding protein [Pontivivens ytuae]|uniref:histidine kinase n=1 Tax=Pontivivens ytuae TaxID=2789856 RepID=A0A7S9LRA7_9RHOB|nr:ATP-binding protein [Pontivivens ytuae]QPH53681.1 HAMP domain-containing protein [Pontivivens ytuae]